MSDEVDVPTEELEVIPEAVTEDWQPENYTVPTYDDPGNFDGHEGAVENA